MPPTTINTHEYETTRERQIRLAISLDESSDLIETIRRLRLKAWFVEMVDLYVEDSFGRESSEEFRLLAEAIGSLPKLISLRIKSGGSFSGRFVQIPFSVLKTLLELSKHSLKRLRLSYMDLTFPEAEAGVTCPLVALSKLMEHNKNLKALHINYGGFRKISRASQRAFLQMLLYKNYALEALDFDDRTMRQFSHSKRKQMQFYLALNQAGLRQKLLDSKTAATSQEWEDAVICNRDQSSTVYYLLSNNPTMICV